MKKAKIKWFSSTVTVPEMNYEAFKADSIPDYEPKLKKGGAGSLADKRVQQAHKDSYTDSKPSVVRAVANFYVLDILAVYARRANEFSRAEVRFAEDVLSKKRDYDARLARVLFDYLAMACFGEARHVGRGQGREVEQYRKEHPEEAEDLRKARESVLARGYIPGNRSQAVPFASLFDPHEFLQVCITLFGGLDEVGCERWRERGMSCGCDDEEDCMIDKPARPYTWSSGYGGFKWAKIAEAALTYFSLPAAAFVDHVVDLSHNGSFAFDKCMLLSFSPSADSSAYKLLLNWKRDSNPFNLTRLCTADVKMLVERAVGCGFIEEQECSDSSCPYELSSWDRLYSMGATNLDKIHFPPVIRWGRMSCSSPQAARTMKNINRLRENSVKQLDGGSKWSYILSALNGAPVKALDKELGEVVTVLHADEFGRIAVEYREPVAAGHSCLSLGENGKCLYLAEKRLGDLPVALSGVAHGDYVRVLDFDIMNPEVPFSEQVIIGKVVPSLRDEAREDYVSSVVLVDLSISLDYDRMKPMLNYGYNIEKSEKHYRYITRYTVVSAEAAQPFIKQDEKEECHV